MTTFEVTIRVQPFTASSAEGKREVWGWYVSAGATTESGIESTRLKAWRTAVKCARDDFGPVR